MELALARRETEPQEDVDLAAVARRAAERLHRRTGRTVRIDTDGSVVRARRAHLERAVGNVLENAARFDDGGRETIEVHIEDGTTTVRDRGPGIDTADAARVFDRFDRSDSARALPGSGLGLAIVLDVAESHGGTAFVSHPQGGGAAVGFGVDRTRLLPESASARLGTPPRSFTVDGT